MNFKYTVFAVVLLNNYCLALEKLCNKIENVTESRVVPEIIPLKEKLYALCPGFFDACWKTTNVTKYVYKDFTEEKTIKVCCEGYLETCGQCYAICEPPCKYAECIAPNLCSCYEGYKPEDNSNTCSPICSETCINGDCVAPGVCRCLDGYAYRNSSYCDPICNLDCLNGSCIAPNECFCFEGYQKNQNGQCEIGTNFNFKCINGTIIDSNKCECPDKFIKDDYIENGVKQGEICRPLCDPPCCNGKCLENGNCECDKEFKMYDNICIPNCMIECLDKENEHIKFYDRDLAYDSDELHSFMVLTKMDKSKYSYEDPTSRIICQDVCNMECNLDNLDSCMCIEGMKLNENGFCVKGYRNDTQEDEVDDEVDDSTETIEPPKINCDSKCVNNCENDVCICEEGYALSNETGNCNLINKDTDNIPDDGKTSYTGLYIGIGSAVIAIIGLVIIFIYNRRKRVFPYYIDQ